MLCGLGSIEVAFLNAGKLREVVLNLEMFDVTWHFLFHLNQNNRSFEAQAKRSKYRMQTKHKEILCLFLSEDVVVNEGRSSEWPRPTNQADSSACHLAWLRCRLVTVASQLGLFKNITTMRMKK